MSNKHIPLVIIEWHDHSSYDGWRTLKRARKGDHYTFSSVGWLLDNNKTHYVLAATREPDGDSYSAITNIVKSAARIKKVLSK